MVKPIVSYKFSGKDRLLIDTSVLLRVFAGNVAGRDAVKEYGNAHKRMIAAKSKLHVDIVVITEYVRICLNHVWNKPHLRELSFEKFRKKRDYKDAVRKIAPTVRNIFKVCSPIESNFSGVKMGMLLKDYETGKHGFNDQFIANLCRSKSMRLVTHDKDFIAAGVTVLTANKRLLKAGS